MSACLPFRVSSGRKVSGRGYTLPIGYRMIHVKGHPLADSEHRIYEHRYIAFELWGPGPQSCFDCGGHIVWGRGRHQGLIIVDHVDHDRANNRRENLRPACFSCNASNRGPRVRPV